VEYDRNGELRKTRIKSESDSSDDDYHYNDDDLEEIENVDFHTEGNDSVVIKNIATQDPFLTKFCSVGFCLGMEPILSMRYETPQQLKMALANYGVAYGYQLWYMKNDWRQVLVYCSRNIVEGRCASKKGNKHIVLPNKVRTNLFRGDEGNQASKKPVKKDVKKPVNKKPDSQSGEVFKEIIEDPFMPLRKMRDDIRQKFMIDVSVKQCKRAKQLALFDHEGGLIEHYAKLYQYRQALLDSNPGSTCILDVVESDNGSVSFKRMYIYFKGMKDGWLAGCRKGLIDAVNDWLPEAEHKKCTRHIYANFKKKFSGLQYQRLFWVAASYRKCATFENGISESFNRAILGPRMKPIITMLEEIRLYIMQRIVPMNKLAFNLEDTITPSIRKRLEILKEKQREWIVYPSGFQELEVRKGDQSYGVSLQHKVLAIGLVRSHGLMHISFPLNQSLGQILFILSTAKPRVSTAQVTTASTNQLVLLEDSGRYEHDMEFEIDFNAAKKVSTTEKDVSTVELVSTAGAIVTTDSVAGRVQKNQRKRRFTLKALGSTGISSELEIILRAYQSEKEQLRGYSFDKINTLFEITMRRVNTFVLIESKVDRAVPELAAESSKSTRKYLEYHQSRNHIRFTSLLVDMLKTLTRMHSDVVASADGVMEASNSIIHDLTWKLYDSLAIYSGVVSPLATRKVHVHG
ncbi:hypothetical protein Tco_1088644, partial [Tanacetum coccineum]